MNFDEITHDILIKKYHIMALTKPRIIFSTFILIAVCFIIYLCLSENEGKIQIQKSTEQKEISIKKINIYDAVFFQYLKSGKFVKASSALELCSASIKNKYEKKIRLALSYIKLIITTAEIDDCKSRLKRTICFYRLHLLFPDILRTTDKIEKEYKKSLKVCKSHSDRLKLTKMLLELYPKNSEGLSFYASSRKKGISLFIKGYSMLGKNPTRARSLIQGSLNYLLPSEKYFIIGTNILKKKN